MIYDGSPVNLNVTNMNGTRVSPSVEEEFLFVCVVEGDPRPGVSWYKAGILRGTPDTLRLVLSHLSCESMWHPRQNNI